MGEEAAKIFDKIILRHDIDMRGRTVEEVEQLLLKGIRKINDILPVPRSVPEMESAYAIVKPKKILKMTYQTSGLLL